MFTSTRGPVPWDLKPDVLPRNRKEKDKLYKCWRAAVLDLRYRYPVGVEMGGIKPKKQSHYYS